MRLYIQLLFNVLLIVFFARLLHFLNASWEAINRGTCCTVLSSFIWKATMWASCSYILWMLFTIGSLFNCFSELFLLPSHEVSSFPCLSVTDFFKFNQFLHLFFSLFLLLVSEAPLPLLLLNFNVFCSVPMLLSLEPLKVQCSSIQIILWDTPQIRGIVYHIISINLLLIARHIQEVGDIGNCICSLMSIQLLLESFHGSLSHGKFLQLTCLSLRKLQLLLFSKSVLSMFLCMFHKHSHRRNITLTDRRICLLLSQSVFLIIVVIRRWSI